jgi:hypothetical protein
MFRDLPHKQLHIVNFGNIVEFELLQLSAVIGT